MISRDARTKPLCIGSLIVALLVGCHTPNQLSKDGGNDAPCDLVLRNGKIVTMDAAKPQAEAIAVRGDTIVALGSNREIEKFIGRSTKTIDLAGKLAVPGFIEGHGH